MDEGKSIICFFREPLHFLFQERRDIVYDKVLKRAKEIGGDIRRCMILKDWHKQGDIFVFVIAVQ